MLVEGEWLEAHLDDPSVVVVDMRWRGDGSGRSRWRESRIPGAVHLDWATDIVDPDGEFAFMLAPPAVFSAAMERAGIGDDSTVVAYADEQGSGPYRLWWAFRVYGHEDGVRILNGEWERWVADGHPVSHEPPSKPRAGAVWTPRPSAVRPATVGDVLDAAERDDVVVIDSRPPEQHAGRAVWFESGHVEPDAAGVSHTPRGDIRAGRIPWAHNIPASELYADDGRIKEPNELRELFAEAGVREGTGAITQCGVGISASALLYALDRAGIDDAKLYDASWEEWGRRPDLPIEREEGRSTMNNEQAALETNGVTTELLATVDLGPEIEGMAGRQLRMRMVTIEPGGVFGPVHDHRDRPGIVYVLQGTITDHRGGVATDYGPGVGWPEDRNTSHWLENRGTNPAVEISVDIVRYEEAPAGDEFPSGSGA